MGEIPNSNTLEQIEPYHMDGVWFDEFAAIEDRHVFEYFSGDSDYRLEQKRLFEAGEITNPNLGYPKLDIAELKAKEHQFLAFKAWVLESDKPDSLKEIYRWSINERIAENRMAQEAALARDTKKPVEKERHMRRFEKYGEFLYGRQNENVFGYYVNQIRAQALAMLESEDSIKVAAATDVLELLPHQLNDSEDITVSDDAVSFTEVREAVLSEYGYSPDQVEEFMAINGDMDAEQLAQFMTEQKDEHIPHAHQYDIFADPEISTTTFNPVRRDLRVPTELNGEQRTFKPKQAFGLNMHENRGHLERSARGYSSRVKLLGYGFDRNFKVEEGNAKLNEVSGSEELDPMLGWQGVVSAGLARGLEKPRGEERQAARRDFRATDEAMKKILFMRGLDMGREPDLAAKKAETISWGATVRIFRGTTCDLPGVIYPKDIGYGEGFHETYAFVQKDTRRLGLLKFGRWTPVNERHVMVALDLEILDPELEELAREL